MGHKIPIKPILILDQTENRPNQNQRTDSIQRQKHSNPVALFPPLSRSHMALGRRFGSGGSGDTAVENRSDDNEETEKEELDD